MRKLGKMNKLTLALSSVCILCPVSVNAEIDWRGYATIAGGKTFDGGTSYDKVTDQLRVDRMSLLGLQGSSDLSDGLSATVQIVGRGINNFDPEFEWAFVKYEFNDKFDVKFGRLRAPFYYYSEYLDVSYAYSWITPPIEMYASNVTSYDGIAFYYADSIGSFDYAAYAGMGTRELTLTAGDLAGNYDAITVFDLGYGDFKTKFIYSVFEISLTSDTLETVQNALAGLDGAFVVKDMPGYIAGVAAYYDPGSYYLGVEYAELRFDKDIIAVSEDDRFLATVGYRYSDFTLHYSFSSSDKTNGIEKLLTTSDPRYATAKSVADAVTSDDKTHIVGLRYDFHPNAALKFEYGFTDDDYIDQDTQFFRTGVSIIF
ncbi:hypothetical protein GCM10007938_17110 [Vibrio zhanjiangensis]|uniref:Porin n=1 Tax=Vibrio zhanjiangensis TaxID=1046128 RepID=A0ABQ6EXM9_9VIBR|nr:hypothetical protein [Vibrio zhanjiangensis]GLT17933.1 hypothetical protein GCM10007938_17110 [Vibrio zhanjiangensis]